MLGKIAWPYTLGNILYIARTFPGDSTLALVFSDLANQKVELYFQESYEK